METQIGTEVDTQNRTVTGQDIAAAPKAVRLPKTHQDYWKAKLKHRRYRDAGGKLIEIPEWQVRMFFLGREAWFNLGTPNQAAAAVKAKNIYMSLQAHGWDTTLATYKPRPEITPESCTVGDFIEDVTARGDLSPTTLRGYVSSLRTIVSGIANVEAGLRGKAKRAKWDYVNGGNAAWREKVDAQLLSVLTPDSVNLWRNRFVARAGSDEKRRESAKRTAAAYIRCSRSLFTPDLIAMLKVKLPPNPFLGVKLAAPRAERYRSDVNPVWLVTCALRELAKSEPQQFLAFTLALWAGLRKKEADLLMWEQVDLAERQIHIRRTRWFKPKTEDSIRSIDLGSEITELLRSMKKGAASEFVLVGNDPNPEATYSYYRCKHTWKSLIQWMRGKGISQTKAIHMLRKESGSWVAATHGIEAARQHLGHSDIRTTSDTYVEKKKRIEVAIPLKPELRAVG